MKLKKSVSDYLETKKDLSGYPTYKSCSHHLMVNFDLHDIDMAGDMLTSQRKRIINKTRNLFSSIEGKMSKKSKNTIFFTLTMLKSVLKFVENETGSVFWSAYEVSQEKKDIQILDVEFAKGLVTDSHAIYETLDENLKTVHDLSCVMLTTCLRFSDAKNLTKRDITDGRVSVKNQKTGVLTSSPMPEILVNRLMKSKRVSIYRKDISKDTFYRLFPVLFALYPEMQGTVNGVPLYKAVKFHVFRKTAISVMLAMGVPMTVVMRASGHAVGSKAFQRYVGYVETTHNKEIGNFQDKFYGTV